MTTQEISAAIINTASAYGVDPRLALEVAMVESNLDPAAISSAGAIGIFQLEPATAADLGVDPNDPMENIDGGVRYLAQMLAKYAGNVAEALGANDWGPGNLDKAIAAHGSDWLSYAPSETQHYVQTILANVGSQYSVALNAPTPLPGVETGQSGFSMGTVLWIGAAVLTGWFLFNLLD